MTEPAARPIDRSAIPFAHWSMRVGRGDDAWGEIVAEMADLEQGIVTLILTPKRSVPTEPEKGCDLIETIDRVPSDIPAMIVSIFDALAAYHPRIVVATVDVRAIDFAHYEVIVEWRPTAAVVDELIRTTVAVGSGAALAQSLAGRGRIAA